MTSVHLCLPPAVPAAEEKLTSGIPSSLCSLGCSSLLKLTISLGNVVKLLERLRFDLQSVSERYWCSGVGHEDLRLSFCLYLLLFQVTGILN